MTWSALVLAGSRGQADPVAQVASVRHKAFAPIHGKPMIAYVLEALEQVEILETIAVSIEPDAASLPKGVMRLDAAPSPSASVLQAMANLPLPILVTTADNPLLTPDIVAYFLHEAGNSGCDVVAGVATRQTVEAAGSTARRTYMTFSDGAISGCNLFALATEQSRRAVVFWQRLEALRKSPLAMARTLGLGTLLRYRIGALSRDAAVMALARKASCRAGLVNLPFPDAAHDVDKPEDLAFVTARLATPHDPSKPQDRP